MTDDEKREAFKEYLATVLDCDPSEITNWVATIQTTRGLAVLHNMCCKHHIAAGLHKIAEDLENQYSAEVN